MLPNLVNPGSFRAKPPYFVQGVAMHRFFLPALSAALLLSFCTNFNTTDLYAQDENLFSEVAMESVFEEIDDNKESTATRNYRTAPENQSFTRITGASMLQEVVKATGYTPTVDDGIVTFEMKHDGWIFPVTMSVVLEEDRITCDFSLASIEDKSTVSRDKLLDLLTSGDPKLNAFFGYSDVDQQIQLRAALSNRSVTARQLKTDLSRLADLAVGKSDVWSAIASEEATKTSTTTLPENNSQPTTPTDRSNNTTTQSQVTNSTKASIIGTWSATISESEAFALKINVDKTFQLVHVKGGKSTVSKGTASSLGTKLTLAGDDTTLNCTISNMTKDKFTLAVNDNAGKTLVSLNFVRAQ